MEMDLILNMFLHMEMYESDRPNKTPEYPISSRDKYFQIVVTSCHLNIFPGCDVFFEGCL